MSPILIVGIVAAALVGLVYVLSYFGYLPREPWQWVVCAICYTAVAALIPALAYTAIEFEHLDHLLWWAMPLAAALALLFFATRGSEVPWAITLGLQGLRVWALILLASLAGYGLALRYDEMDLYHWLAVFFGVLVGASEILSRYRDEPAAALFSLPGLLYLTINGAISAATFSLLRYYQDDLFPTLQGDPLMISILAGFGAMVVMRSKLFSLRTSGGEEFAVGPDAIIAIFLRSVDRAIDRQRSLSRQRLVFRTTKDLSFSQRVADFFKGALAAYQNLSNEEKAELKKVVDEVSARTDMDPHLKLMAIAFGFLNVGGEDNYNQLIVDLKAFLASPPAASPPPPPPPPPPPSPPPPPVSH